MNKIRTKGITKIKQFSIKKLLIQIVEYMVAGGVWFWSGYFLIIWLDGPLGLFVANIIGNGVGVTLNYLLQRYWVFASDAPAASNAAIRRYVVYTAINSFGLNYLLLHTLDHRWGIGPEVGQFISARIFMIWNYVWYRYWVFKDDNDTSEITANT